MAILESFLAGKEARRVADAAAQINAMQQFVGQNGQAIMAGDQNALGKLAGFGVEGLNTAMNIQGTVQDRQMRQEELAYTRDRRAVEDGREDQQWQMQVEEYKAGKTAAELAAEAAKIEEGVKMALAAPTPEAFDQMMQQLGMPDMVGQFEIREMLAARYMSVAEVLKANAPPDPNDRYKVVGGSLFDLGAEGGPAPVGQGAMQETTVFGPDGKPVMVQGGPGSAAKFTEGQSRDNVYATRAEGALAKLEPVADELAGRAGRIGDALGGITIGLSREMLQGDGYQVAKQAGDEFLQAILRKDTGAAITQPEQELYGITYLPQPGDGDAVLRAKQEARARALEAIRAGMNVQQLETVARADQAAIARLAAQDAAQGALPTTSGPQPGMVEDGYRFKGGDPADPANWEPAQ